MAHLEAPVKYVGAFSGGSCVTQLALRKMTCEDIVVNGKVFKMPDSR